MARDLEELPVEIAALTPEISKLAAAEAEARTASGELPRVDPGRGAFFVTFWDRFLREENIKWILVAGVLILLASSIKLVGTLWDDSTAAAKQLILLAYTTGFFALSQAAYWRIGLRKTGTILMALTVLLVPICFVGLHWVFAHHSEGLWSLSRNLALLGGTAALGWYASRTIFTHFLRTTQPTFVASYLLLSAAAAFVPAVPANWWPLTTLALWSAFTIGTVKVNRHVFWMAEEYRLPRIFGFFPIALLGTQFVWLFLWQVGANVPRDWLGLVLVLVAVPILLTADAVAHVFQERTGDLVRPLPWSIVAPMILSLVFCAGGIALALTRLPLPPALTPTALLTAVVLSTVAWRTGHRGFVWSALISIVLAYNFSFVFFQDVARAVVQSGASAVREQRLPFAFYGLTYLPLIAAVIASARILTGIRAPMPVIARVRDLWCSPLRQFVTALCGVLLVASVTHPKALLPVAAAMCAAFFVQAFVFGAPRLVLPAIAGYLAATAGVTPFCSSVLDLSLSGDSWMVVWSVAAVGLLGPGYFVDRWGNGLRTILARESMSNSIAPQAVETNWCRIASLGVTLILAAVSFHQLFPWNGGVVNVFPVACAVTLLATHALVAARPGLGLLTLCYGGAAAALLALTHQVPLLSVLNGAEFGLLALWGASYLLDRSPESRVSRTFAGPSRLVSLFALTLIAGFHLVSLMTNLVLPGSSPNGIATLAMLIWGVDASRRTQSGFWSGLSSALMFALVGSFWLHDVSPDSGRQWLVSVWSLLGLGLVPVLSLLRRKISALENLPADCDPAPLARLRAIALPFEFITFAVLSVIAVGSLMWMTVPIRVAGGIAALAWVIHGTLSRNRDLYRGALVLGNWQLLCLVLWLSVPEAQFLFALDRDQFHQAAIPLAAAAAISLLVVRELRGPLTQGKRDDLLDGHGALLHVLAASGLLFAGVMPVDSLSSLDIGLALVAFGALAVEAIRLAIARRDELCVWWAEGLAALAVLFFWRCGVIEFGHGVAMFVVLAVGLAAWTIGRLAKANERIAVLAGPLTRTGLVLPLATVAIGVTRALGNTPPLWLGANSLALFFAAAFYFWRGIEGRDKRLTLTATAIVNVSLCLLWRELEFSDPQFFMIPIGLSIVGVVEILRTEIPRKFHDPLRYAGALTILVSPTFHIVEGSWLHLATLMVAAVAICLLAIGLQVRALMYTGSAFLLADLVAIVIRGGIDRPNVLWIVGILFGTVVIVLGAICEKHREDVLQKLRILSARLETWS